MRSAGSEAHEHRTGEHPAQRTLVADRLGATLRDLGDGLGWTALRMAWCGPKPCAAPPRVTGGHRPRRPPNGRACAKHRRWIADRARIRGKLCGPGGARRLVRRAAPVEASNDRPLAAWLCCVSCLVGGPQASHEGMSEAKPERERRPPGRDALVNSPLAGDARHQPRASAPCSSGQRPRPPQRASAKHRRCIHGRAHWV